MAGFRDGVFTTGDLVDTSGNPFTDASLYANEIRLFVEQQFSYIKSSVLGSDNANALSAANAAIEALKSFDFTFPDDPTMVRPDVNWTVDVEFDLPNVDPSQFGSITPWSLGDAPDIGTLPSVSTITIPSFNPSINSIYIPDAPDPALIPEPGDAPLSPGFTYPDEPDIVLPDRPVLTDINLPNWTGVDIPTLEDLTFPELEPMNIQTYINWSEPTYSPEIWTDVKAQIERFFAGGSGIRPEIEESIVARGRDREDRLVRQQEMQATDEWAGRGFTAPPGMLVKRIDNIREEGLLKKLGLQRDVVIKAMDEELANIRLAVQQGIVAEQLFVQIHLAAVDRLFLVERLHVEWEIQKYNLLIEVFKAKFQENLIRAQVYEVRVRAALAEIEIFKALIDAERVKAEINKTLIEAYTAEIQARETLVNLYKTQIEAVEVQARVFETEVRAYGQEVAAFGERVNADKLRFDAYESQVRGEAAKAGIIEAEARAYAAEIQGIDTGVRAEVAALEGYVSGFRAEVEGYEAQLRGLIGKNQAELGAIQANVAGYQANTARFTAAAGAEEAKSRVELAAWDAENRLNLGWFEAQLKEFELRIQKIINQKNLMLEAVKASGDLASTISAGALAAMNAGAQIQGQGSVGARGNDSTQFSWDTRQSKSCSTSKDISINYEAETEPSLDCII